MRRVVQWSSDAIYRTLCDFLLLLKARCVALHTAVVTLFIALCVTLFFSEGEMCRVVHSSSNAIYHTLCDSLLILKARCVALHAAVVTLFIALCVTLFFSEGEMCRVVHSSSDAIYHTLCDSLLL